MSTVNATENAENTENFENAEKFEHTEKFANAERPEPAVTERPEPDSRPTGEPDAPATAEETPTPTAAGTSVYVRRGRTPTLGFWVAIALAVPAVLALLSAPFFDFVDLGGVVNFVLIAVVFVGLPLAAVVAAVDAYRHRERAPRSR